MSDPQPEGLRERKRAKTRTAIQQHALRLFSQQGYEETTVEQIAEAVEISPSTFFRYFATKEDCVVYDVLDPLIFSAFPSQPPELCPLQALRAAIRVLFGPLDPEESERQRERAKLAFEVPELRMKMVEQILASMSPFTRVVAKRVGRDPDDMAVRTFVGAIVGAVLMGEMDIMKDPQADASALIDTALAQLDAGLTSLGVKLPL
ncbi:MAG: TetR family transcriptional regulator [Spirochaetia bacterium]